MCGYVHKVVGSYPMSDKALMSPLGPCERPLSPNFSRNAVWLWHTCILSVWESTPLITFYQGDSSYWKDQGLKWSLPGACFSFFFIFKGRLALGLKYVPHVLYHLCFEVINMNRCLKYLLFTTNIQMQWITSKNKSKIQNISKEFNYIEFTVITVSRFTILFFAVMTIIMSVL